MMILNQVHAKTFALPPHVVGPNAGLDFADMAFVQKHHAKTTLSNTTTNGEGQTVVEQLLVEIQLFAFLLMLKLQLSQQALFIDTDTHGR